MATKETYLIDVLKKYLGIYNSQLQSMVRIYIRHAEKLYGNLTTAPTKLGPPYEKFDPPLTMKGKQDALVLARELLTVFGPPKYIVVSPYRRCRETAEIMRQVVPTTAIYVDVRLSEYLGNHPNEPLEVTPETKHYNPPHPESIADYDRRLGSHHREFSIFDEDKEPVWVIAHGMTLARIARLACGYQRLRPGYLAALHIAAGSGGHKVCQMLNGPRPGVLTAPVSA